MTALKQHSVLSESCALVNPLMLRGINVLALPPLHFQLPNQPRRGDQTEEIKETLQTVSVIFIKSQLQHFWL